MKILPPETHLPSAPLRRRHLPEPASYPEYRQCLRWEFGFSCAFCLLHEADLTENGIEGTGLTGIEHRVTRSSAPAQEDVYGNCYYACRFCNGARGAQPSESNGRRLLDPCADSWRAHFNIEDDAFVAVDADVNAEYTLAAYDLADPRKRACRAARRQTIQSALNIIRETPRVVERLERAASRQSGRDRVFLLQAAHDYRQARQRALEQLLRYQLIPEDALSCRCGRHGSLPAFLKAQLVEVS